MIYYDESKRKWIDEQEPLGWTECVFGAVIFILFLAGLFGGSI